MQRLKIAGRRFDAANKERHAALHELSAACAARPDLSLDELTRATGVASAGLIAIRMRLTKAPPEQ